MDALTLDVYEERRRKWRRSGFWRGVLVTLAILIGLAVLGAFLGERNAGPHIARYTVSGTIFDNSERSALLADLKEDENARALIVHVASPGGTTVGAEALYADIRAIGETRPIVMVLGEIAASGGYITAIAGDHIIARGNTLTGSIGVIMEYPDVTDLMSRLGVAMETVRSSELKAEPSPFRSGSPAAKARQAELIEDSYQWFRGLVAERRNLSGQQLDTVASGTVFTGRQALDNGLIDEIGAEAEAITYLESVDSELTDLPIRDWALKPERSGLLNLITGMTQNGGFSLPQTLVNGPVLSSLYK